MSEKILIVDDDQTMRFFLTEALKKRGYEDILKERGISIDSISIDFIGDIAIIRLRAVSYTHLTLPTN